MAGAIIIISADTPVKNKYTLNKDYTIFIYGTSNIHDWNEQVQTATGEGLVKVNDGSFDLLAISIKIAVHSIHSDIGSAMNNNTYKALKADANPEIIFTLTEQILFIPLKTSETAITAKGNLTIAGVTRPISMSGKILMQTAGKISFEGSQTIKMTDYGIDPPKALFGTLKTGNEITVSFKTNFLITAN